MIDADAVVAEQKVLLLAVKQEVATVEKEVAAAEKEVAAAEKEVAAAEKKVAAAEKDILAAEQRGDAFGKKMAITYWEASSKCLSASFEGLIGAQKYLTAARTAAGFILVERHRPSLQSNTRTEQLSIHQKLDALLSWQNQHNGRATPEKTPASLGEREKERLLKAGRMKAFEDKPGQAAVLTEGELRELDSCTSEHQVVAFLTSPFEKIFGEKSLCVVNSEEYTWLETSGDPRYNQKPDLMFCHRAIYTPHDPPQIKDERAENMRRENDKFGVLTNWVLRDCISATGEAKLKIDNEAFGEVINYGAHLCWDSGRDSAPDEARLVLFDKSEFWLVEIVRGYVFRVTTCGWTVEGSRTLLSSFPFSSPEWMELLDAACDHSHLVVEANAFWATVLLSCVSSSSR